MLTLICIKICSLLFSFWVLFTTIQRHLGVRFITNGVWKEIAQNLSRKYRRLFRDCFRNLTSMFKIVRSGQIVWSEHSNKVNDSQYSVYVVFKSRWLKHYITNIDVKYAWNEKKANTFSNSIALQNIWAHVP